VICPACHIEIQENLSQCPRCQFNIFLYRKLKAISLRLYNKGLEQANNRELTNAIGSLSKAVEFDKTNINARNLLGLVYYEIGEFGQALAEWVISTHFQKEDNIALDYIKRIQRSGRKLEQYNDSIRMFNQAIEYAGQRSEDLAIIQLKKALQLNPNFVEACCLVALCLLKENEKEKALPYIEKALEIDMSNSKAIRYYRELRPNSFIPRREDKSTATIRAHRRRKSKAPFSPMGHIIGFVVGAICTAALLLILVIPDRVNVLTKQIEDLDIKNQNLEIEYSRLKQESQETISDLEEENRKVLDMNGQLQQRQIALEEVQKINQVQILYNNKKIEDAAVLLYSLDAFNIPEENRATYDELSNKVFIDAASAHYNNGQSAYSRKDYDKAIVELEKSLLYAREQYYSDNALYYLGRIYEEQDNIEKAKEFYSQAIDQYPGTDGAANSKWRLGKLK